MDDDDYPTGAAVVYLILALALVMVAIGFIIGYVVQSHGWVLPLGW